MIEKSINIFGSNLAHDEVPEVRQNVIIQILPIAVIGIRRETLLTRMKRKPFLGKISVGLSGIVVGISSLGQCYGNLYLELFRNSFCADTPAPPS